MCEDVVFTLHRLRLFECDLRILISEHFPVVSIQSSFDADDMQYLQKFDCLTISDFRFCSMPLQNGLRNKL